MTVPAAVDPDAYRELLDRVFDDTVTGWTADAEAAERFPRKLIEHLGSAGVFRAKWGPQGGQHPDVAKRIVEGGSKRLSASIAGSFSSNARFRLF